MTYFLNLLCMINCGVLGSSPAHTACCSTYCCACAHFNYICCVLPMRFTPGSSQGPLPSSLLLPSSDLVTFSYLTPPAFTSDPWVPTFPHSLFINMAGPVDLFSFQSTNHSEVAWSILPNGPDMIAPVHCPLLESTPHSTFLGSLSSDSLCVVREKFLIFNTRQGSVFLLSLPLSRSDWSSVMAALAL